MKNYNLDTLQYNVTPLEIKGYELIQDQLNRVEERLLAGRSDHHSLMTDAAVQLFEAGGKRMRTAICLLCTGIFDAVHDTSISLAAGVEMLHTATLVHDDVLDRAAMRRGRPTLNAGSNANFSILIGDYFFARAANLVAETDNIDIMKLFSETLMTILNGEVSQQNSRWKIDRHDYYDRIYAKTGAMFVLAAKSGGILGDASEDQLLALEKYGYYTGIAFQIIDDIMDFTSQQTRLGKPVGGDLREGIFTLPVIRYADRHPHDPDLKQLIQTQDGSHPATEDLIASILESDAIEASMAEARELVSRAQDALDSFHYSEYIEALTSLANTIVERDY